MVRSKWQGVQLQVAEVTPGDVYIASKLNLLLSVKSDAIFTYTFKCGFHRCATHFASAEAITQGKVLASIFKDYTQYAVG